MPELVPATAEIISRVTDEPLPRTVRAIAAVEGDRVIAVAGYYPENGGVVVFSTFSKEARKDMRRHGRTIVRGWRVVVGMVRDLRLPIYAICDSRFENAESMLHHLGFTREYGEVFQWRG